MPVRSRLRVHIQPRSRFRHIHRTAVERLTSARRSPRRDALRVAVTELSPTVAGEQCFKAYTNESRLSLSENPQKSKEGSALRAIRSEWLALDLRSLALMRIGLGLLCCFDAVTRLLFFRAHYTAAGVLPLSSQLAPGSRASSLWSVSFLSDSWLWAGLCLSLYALAGLSLALGYRSRIAGWLCWILAVSIQRRVPLLNDGGDAYLVALLFWANFMPLEGAFSIRSAPNPHTLYSRLPGFCYIAQVAVLYWFSAVLRTGREWQVDSSALYYALLIPSMAAWAAPYLLALGTKALAFFTDATLFLEQIGPVLLFLPFERLRLVSVTLIVGFHLGIMASIRIPFFATLCVVGALGLLPAKFWELGFVHRSAQSIEAILARSNYRCQTTGLALKSDRGWTDTAFNFAPAFFFLVVLSNLYAGIFSLSPETALSPLSRNLSLNQRWGMFSPHASNVIGWETVVGLTATGREVGLLEDEVAPRNPWEFANHEGFLEYRWRLFHQALSYGVKLPTDTYLQYLVARWEEEHPDESLVAAEYRYHPRVSAPNYLLGDEMTVVLATWRKTGVSPRTTEKDDSRA